MTVESLTAAGMEKMSADEIRQFLSSQGFGILGLADEPQPYLLPMSFGYDSEDNLYFTYVVGEQSRKERLTRETGRAAFLVYDAPSAFQWQSVVLTGTIERLPADQWDEAEDVSENAWRPDIFENADGDISARIYRFRTETREGYKHTGLPPGFED